MSARTRNLWRSLHLWLAVLAAIPLLVTGVTGVLLAYVEPIEQWLEPEVFAVEATGEALRPSVIAARLRSAYPDATLHHVGVPSSPPDYPYTVFASAPGAEGRERFMLFADPYTGTVQQRSDRGPMQVVEAIHRNLTFGQAGRYWVSGSSILLIAISIIGVYLWWPMRANTVRRMVRRRDAMNWHMVTGLLVLPVLALIALTGVTLTFNKQVIPFLYAVTNSPQMPEPPRVELQNEAALSLAEAVQAVERKLPQAQITAFSDRKHADSPYVVRVKYPGEMHPGGWERVFVHPGTGEFLGRFNAYEHSPASAYQHSWYMWHTGSMLGGIGTVLWSIVSATLVLIVVTGVVLWSRRRSRRVRTTASGRR